MILYPFLEFLIANFPTQIIFNPGSSGSQSSLDAYRMKL